MRGIRGLLGRDIADAAAVPGQAAVEGAGNSTLPILWIVLSAIALIASIMVGTAFMAGDFRERALSSGKRELENTVLLLTRHFDQKFEDISQSQARLGVKLWIDSIVSPAEFRQQLSGPKVHALLEREVRNSFDMGEIFLFDVDGKLVNTSQPGAMPYFDVSEHAYFQAFKANTATTFVEPLVSRLEAMDHGLRQPARDGGRRLPRRHGPAHATAAIRGLL